MILSSERGRIRMVLAGDVMPSRPLTMFQEPEYLALRDLLQGADYTFANLETTVRRPDEGAPIFTRGTPMSTPPELLDDVRWLGVDVVSCANNHATDYGIEGMMASVRHLRAARLPACGLGASMAEALAPAYVETPAGRVATVAATAFFPPGSRAADPRPDAPGRPGVAALGFTSRYTVDGAAFEQLRRIDDALGFKALRTRKKSEFYGPGEIGVDDPQRLEVLGADFSLGDGFAVHSRAHQGDVDRLLRSLKEARRQADWVVFSFHYHEFGPAGAREAMLSTELREPAQFVREVACAAIDAGADVVVGHGPHVTLGVELHRGKPILYSLGNFLFQNETVASIPAESYARFGLGPQATPADFFDARTGHDTRGFPASPEYWQSVVAECEFSATGLAGVRLHAIDLGFGRPRSQRGRPVLARGEVAEACLRRVANLSLPHGSAFRIEGAVAHLVEP